MTDRNVTIGAGPFQPPSHEQVRTLRESLRRAETEADSLREANRDLARKLRVDNADELVALVSRVLADNAGVSIDSGDDEIIVTIDGLTINDDGNIVPPVREFEVSTTVSFEHSATLRASDQDEAHDLFVEALRDALHQASVEIESDAVEHQFSHSAEFDYVNVHEA